MPPRKYSSWGKFPIACPKAVTRMQWASDPLPPFQGKILAYGQGRSYGDVCLNESGGIIDTSALNHLLSFDDTTGILTVESGVTLRDITHAFVPKGWFLPVAPGTQYVSIGGAIANDVHGKNQRHAGTFGRHVKGIELLRSTGESLWCSPEQHTDLFNATLGGLGLTGLITKASLQLRRIEGSHMKVMQSKHNNWESCLHAFEELSQTNEYVAAWIDCTSTGKNFGRSVITAGNHDPETKNVDPRWSTPKISIPSWCPKVVNPAFINAYNTLRFTREKAGELPMTIDRFFFQLDDIGSWNNLYGKAGLIQYQCVLPAAAAPTLLDVIRKAAVRPYLTTLKVFKDQPSPALLSFPKEGVCLAFDYARSAESIKLTDSLDIIVRDSGGSVYLAKDACMAVSSFRAYYPRWQELAAHVDPAFSSSLWRRLTA